MKPMRKSIIHRFLSVFLSAVLMLAILAACDAGDGVKKAKLDPKNPVTITIWHYYNSTQMNAFESVVKEFNETVGEQEGIIVEGYSMGNVSELEKAVMASVNKEVGSSEMPNIFASYADTAYAAEQMGILANLDDYLSKDTLDLYVDSFIEEGRIGENGELKIFPVAKSTELLLLNKTDWQPFADANGLSYDDLRTKEGVTRVAASYYNWTDAQTPDVPNDGKAFYGRDSMANLFIVSQREFGKEIFEVNNGEVSLNLEENVIRKIWDNYYVPYISGHFTSYGHFSSEDVKVGDVLCYVGSTASASYFPKEVSKNGEVYPIEAVVLPYPHFDGGEQIMVQQGAGMVVTQSSLEIEYACMKFLEWFTDTKTNVEFAAQSGYFPVRKEAVVYDNFMAALEESEVTIDDMTNETLKASLESMKTNQLYTNKAFQSGSEARALLNDMLQNKAVADRETVLEAIAAGSSQSDAVALQNTDAAFTEFYTELKEALLAVMG